MDNRYFPIFIRMDQKQVLLIGAGNIALRRAKGLLNFGAVLTVIAPRIHPEFVELQKSYGEKSLKLVQREFMPGEIENFDFVLSATDDSQTDVCVCQECKEKKIPVNIASDQTLCDFQFPALIEQDNIVIGVNSGGSDHRKVRSISARIRELL